MQSSGALCRRNGEVLKNPARITLVLLPGSIEPNFKVIVEGQMRNEILDYQNNRAKKRCGKERLSRARYQHSGKLFG